VTFDHHKKGKKHIRAVNKEEPEEGAKKPESRGEFNAPQKEKLA
jgi:hypothetical protein